MYSIRTVMIYGYKTICFGRRDFGIFKPASNTLKTQMSNGFLLESFGIKPFQTNILLSSNTAMEKMRYRSIPRNIGAFTWIHTSAVINYLKSSKVHEAVITLKEQAKEGKAVAKKKKKSLTQSIKEELKHYYNGFKLFCINVKITSKLTMRKLRGQQLTRREQRLLKQTLGDIFKLVPFSVFIIVPFMELTLPIFLKMFPGMLPSTFQTKSAKEEKLKKHFKVKLEMTKFLQETLDEMTPVQGGEVSELAKDFHSFFSKVRTTGEMPSSEEIMKFSKLFEDEITLDRLPRPQIIALCRVLGITPIGTTRFLRYQLKLKLTNLRMDDKIIQKDGINSLTRSELRDACRVRGMRSIGISEERLKEQLQQWLELSLIKKIPPSLLLLSQAFLLSDTSPSDKSLAATIQALPSEVGMATEAVISEREGMVDYETKIHMIEYELRKIGEETSDLRIEELSRKKDQFLMNVSSELPEEAIPSQYRAKLDKYDEGFAMRELAMLEEALKNKLFIEKDCLAELKLHLQQYEMSVSDLNEIVSKMKNTDKRVETLAAKRLHRKLIKMMQKLDEAIIELEKRDRVKPPPPAALSLSPDLIRIEDLVTSIKNRKGKHISVKGELMLTDILNKLDNDKDGIVSINRVSKLLNLIDDYEVAINSKTIDEFIDLIGKEETLEFEEALNKAETKESKKERC